MCDNATPEQRDRAVLTVREAAQILRISKDLAYALAREGKLPVLRLGERRMVIPREAFYRWIEARARDSVE